MIRSITLDVSLFKLRFLAYLWLKFIKDNNLVRKLKWILKGIIYSNCVACVTSRCIGFFIFSKYTIINIWNVRLEGGLWLLRRILRSLVETLSYFSFVLNFMETGFNTLWFTNLSSSILALNFSKEDLVNRETDWDLF